MTSPRHAHSRRYTLINCGLSFAREGALGKARARGHRPPAARAGQRRRRLTSIYRNAALGTTAQAAITDMIEGMGRPIAERLQDAKKGRALGRSEIARGVLDGQEIFLQVAFTRTTLNGANAILAVLSDATELKTLEAR